MQAHKNSTPLGIHARRRAAVCRVVSMRCGTTAFKKGKQKQHPPGHIATASPSSEAARSNTAFRTCRVCGSGENYTWRKTRHFVLGQANRASRDRNHRFCHRSLPVSLNDKGLSGTRWYRITSHVMRESANNVQNIVQLRLLFWKTRESCLFWRCSLILEFIEMIFVSERMQMYS